MTIVFKVSDQLKEELVKYYEDKRRPNTPPYAIFQAMDADTIVTLYESGKIMFQGVSADIDAAMWSQREKKLTGKEVQVNQSDNKKDKHTQEKKGFVEISSIGSDEVGTGDFYGPIVVTACYVPKEKVQILAKLGVKDSKQLTDEKIMEITPNLIKEIDHCTYILNNKDYNKYQALGYNMNKIKSILHNKVLCEMKKKHPSYGKIVVDQFVYPKKYFEHIQEAGEIVRDVTFETKAESKYTSVAASSCISRYVFLDQMNKISKSLDMPIIKGAGIDVDKLTAQIVTRYGEEKLTEIAKMNFKNAEKYKEYMTK